MVLVDTSIWVDHLRTANRGLMRLLEDVEVVTHPFVIGELACGTLGNRKGILSLLDALPKAKTADDDEVLLLIDKHGLHGTGLGYVDVCLLASCFLSGLPLWTNDRQLRNAARRLEIAHS